MSHIPLLLVIWAASGDSAKFKEMGLCKRHTYDQSWIQRPKHRIAESPCMSFTKLVRMCLTSFSGSGVVLGARLDPQLRIVTWSTEGNTYKHALEGYRYISWEQLWMVNLSGSHLEGGISDMDWMVFWDSSCRWWHDSNRHAGEMQDPPGWKEK